MPQFQGPDGCFTITYPDDWTQEVQPEGNVIFHRKESPVGRLRVSAWRSKGGEKELVQFLAAQQKTLAKPGQLETKVLAMEPFATGGKRGFMRVSTAVEGGVLLLTTMFLLGGGSTVLMASYSVPPSYHGTPEGKAESNLVIGMLVGAVLR